MISGHVTAELDAVIPLRLQSATGKPHEIEALIDTGFNGCLSLPAALVEELEFPWQRLALVELADDSEILSDVHTGWVVWDGVLHEIPIDSGGGIPLVGMRLLDGSELRLQVRAGGAVTIEAF